MIYTDFSEISDQFDTLLVDAYGVFWGGKAPIPGSLEAMAMQVSAGKSLCIVSNSCMLGQIVFDDYKKKGLTQGVHYTNVVTSGEVFYSHLRQKDLPWSGNKIYVFGISRWDISTGTDFQLVSSPEEADMVYFGTPQLTKSDLENHPEFQPLARSVRSDPNRFDVANITPFLPELKKIAALGLPALSTNPDLIALENGYWNIRQGTVAQTYRELGGVVEEFGKPYHNIYAYTFQKLGIQPSPRVAMIGDTFRTDIRGALDSGITPVWSLDYGVARYEIEQGHPLTEQAGGSLDGIILIHHL